MNKKQIELNKIIEVEMANLFGPDCVFQIRWTEGKFDFEVSKNDLASPWDFVALFEGGNIYELNDFMSELIEAIKIHTNKKVDYETLWKSFRYYEMT